MEETERPVLKKIPTKNTLEYEAEINGKRFHFIIPKQRPAIVMDIFATWARSNFIATGAIFGHFTVGPKPPGANPADGSMVFGEAVMNHLMLQGYDALDLHEIGFQLYLVMGEALPNFQAKAKEEIDFLG